MHEISDSIKNLVHFKYHNILDEPYGCLPSGGQGFDLILLKNVLIYFEPKKAKMAVDSLFPLLKDGGWLSTTPAEYSMGIFDFPHSEFIRDGYLIEKNLKQKTEVSLPAYEQIADLSENAFEKTTLDPFEKVIKDSLLSSTQNDAKPLLSDKNFYYHDALKMLESGEYKRAKVSLRKAVYLDKGLIRAHIVLGNILIKEGRPDAAARHINNAKAALKQMEPQQEVELSDGITANDLLVMINSIKGEKFE
jgi:tetratricopeptide (TPR) repeat protein